VLLLWESYMGSYEDGTPIFIPPGSLGATVTVAPNDPGGMKIDPLHWGSHFVKGQMATKVKSSHGAPAMKAKFDDAWLLFDKNVRERATVSFYMYSWQI
jgi:hypothetical protein